MIRRMFKGAKSMLDVPVIEDADIDPAWFGHSAKPEKHNRGRATVVVLHQSKVLLVRERGRKRYSLPGGGIKRGEPTISAAARELYEETGLSADRIERAAAYEGRTRVHAVFLITVHHGTAAPKREIDQIMWWDQVQDIPVDDYVVGILQQMSGHSPETV